MNFKKIKSFFLSSEKRALLFLLLGAALNISYATYELFRSFKYSESWAGAVAIYYIFLSSIKFILLKNEKRLKKLSSFWVFKNEGNKVYGFCGILLLILNVITVVFVFGIVFFGTKTRTPIQIVVLAVYAFGRVIIALKDIFHYKNAHNYIVSAAKVISLSVALLALFSLQSSMILVLNIKPFWVKTIGVISGLALLLAEFSISIYMILARSVFYIEKNS